MSEVTTSWASEWDAVLPATRGVSHRATTSSRLPGRVLEGSVSYDISRVIPCPDCGTLRRDLGGPHAPHFNHQGRLVDCAGRLLRGAP